MKKNLLVLIVAASCCMQACAVKYGCPSSGRNMGAEKLLAGDKQSLKLAKKAGKYRTGKF